MPHLLESFLGATSVIDWRHPDVLAAARELGGRRDASVDVARRCFEWVRDRIPHTSDYELEPVTCSASEVLREGTGFCYAKSHLLAALLRANDIPSGLVYQRLALNEEGTAFCLHGLNAVCLPKTGWYRIDARGERHDLHAAFTPPVEVLPFTCTLAGERLFPGIFAEPLPLVVEKLSRHRTRSQLEKDLPDAAAIELAPGADGLVASGAH